MQRKLGLCTWIFGPLALDDIAAETARLGFDGVELHGDLESFRAAEVARLLCDHGLSILSLTPSDCDPAHPEEKVRRQAIDYYHRLIEFAADAREAGAGHPIVSFHGLVTRIKPIESQEAEYAHLVETVRAVDTFAQAADVPMVFEVLNRYESHLINTGAQALRLLDDAGARAMSVLLDAYHMNIEEADPAAAIRTVGKRLGLFHVADSNREGIGRGHTDFAAQIAALDAIGYAGPIIVECTAAGPNPFTPVKGADYLEVLRSYLGESQAWLTQAMG